MDREIIWSIWASDDLVSIAEHISRDSESYAATVVRVVFSPTGAFATALTWVGGVALAVWAVDEVARGVNPFRRIVGGLVLIALIVSRL